MPEKDGIDLLNEILLTGIPTRVVLTSGNGGDLLAVAQDTMRFHGLAGGRVLAKPFRRAALVEVLTRLTNRLSARRTCVTGQATAGFPSLAEIRRRIAKVAEPVLELRGISKSFGAIRALSELTLRWSLAKCWA